MLGSMIKEEICTQIKSELDTILIHLSSSELATNDTSSSSSTISLSNEVIDIDDYIEKVNSPTTNTNTPSEAEPNSPNDPQHQHTPNTDSLSQTKSHKSSKSSFMRRKNSTGSLTSTASSFSSQYTSHVDYRDDFNAAFVSEFKKTDCFREWYEANRANLELSLFKYDPASQQFNVLNPSSATQTSLNVINRIN